MARRGLWADSDPIPPWVWRRSETPQAVACRLEHRRRPARRFSPDRRRGPDSRNTPRPDAAPHAQLVPFQLSARRQPEPTWTDAGFLFYCYQTPFFDFLRPVNGEATPTKALKQAIIDAYKVETIADGGREVRGLLPRSSLARGSTWAAACSCSSDGSSPHLASSRSPIPQAVFPQRSGLCERLDDCVSACRRRAASRYGPCSSGSGCCCSVPVPEGVKARPSSSSRPGLGRTE